MESTNFWPTSLEGVLAVVSYIAGAAATAGAVVWSLIKDKLKRETRDREENDKRIRRVVARHAQLLHNFMGKFELIDQRMHDHELRRMEEIHSLKSDLKDGLNGIRLEIEKLRNSKHEQEN